MMQIDKELKRGTESSNHDSFEALAGMDHNILRYVIKQERDRKGDKAVFDLLTKRGPDGRTLIFNASKEKTELILDELMKTGSKDDVKKFIWTLDNKGNTALFFPNPDKASPILNKLYDVSVPFDVFEFLLHENSEGDTAGSSFKFNEVVKMTERGLSIIRE